MPSLHETMLFAKLKVLIYEKQFIAQKAILLNRILND